MAHGFAFAGTAPEIIRTSAREAEGLGYSSFWVHQPGSTDGLVALALAARETRRIEVGIGVIPCTAGSAANSAGVIQAGGCTGGRTGLTHSTSWSVTPSWRSQRERGSPFRAPDALGVVWGREGVQSTIGF